MELRHMTTDYGFTVNFELGTLNFEQSPLGVWLNLAARMVSITGVMEHRTGG